MKDLSTVRVGSDAEWGIWGTMIFGAVASLLTSWLYRPSWLAQLVAALALGVAGTYLVRLASRHLYRYRHRYRHLHRDQRAGLRSGRGTGGNRATARRPEPVAGTRPSHPETLWVLILFAAVVNVWAVLMTGASVLAAVCVVACMLLFAVPSLRGLGPRPSDWERGAGLPPGGDGPGLGPRHRGRGQRGREQRGREQRVGMDQMAALSIGAAVIIGGQPLVALGGGHQLAGSVNSSPVGPGHSSGKPSARHIAGDVAVPSPGTSQPPDPQLSISRLATPPETRRAAIEPLPVGGKSRTAAAPSSPGAPSAPGTTRPGSTPASPEGRTPASSPAYSDLVGHWRGSWGEHYLRVQGNEVRIVYDLGEGRFIGTARGDTIRGWWSQGSTRKPPGFAGIGEFRIVRQGGTVRLDGSWQRGTELPVYPDWDLTKVDDVIPAPAERRFAETSRFVRAP